MIRVLRTASSFVNFGLSHGTHGISMKGIFVIKTRMLTINAYVISGKLIEVSFLLSLITRIK